MKLDLGLALLAIVCLSFSAWADIPYTCPANGTYGAMEYQYNGLAPVNVNLHEGEYTEIYPPSPGVYARVLMGNMHWNVNNYDEWANLVISGYGINPQVSTYVNDYADRQTEDRMTTPSGNGNNYENYEIKPVFAGGAHTQSGPVDINSNEIIDFYPHGREISGDQFPPLATATLRDPSASGQYTEEQSVWLYAGTVYDGTAKEVVANAPELAYKIDFTHDDYGIPYSTCSNYGSPSCADTDLTARHRVPIKFLGEDWIISGMGFPEGSGPDSFDSWTPDETSLAYAGSSFLQIAKESAYGVVHVGENITAGAYSVKLSDISMDESHVALVEIYDSTGAMLDEKQISPNSTLIWIGPDATHLRIHIYQTQPGYTLQSKWAEMAVYTNELTLTHNARVDNGDNKYWKSYLYWSKNPANNYVPTLKTVILARDYDGALQLRKGEMLGIIGNPENFGVTFGGLDLNESDYDTLSMSIVTTAISYSPTNDVTCMDAVPLQPPASLLYVRSQMASPFFIGMTGISTDHFYLDLNNIGFSAVKGVNATNLYYKQSGISCYFNVSMTSGSILAIYELGDAELPSLVLSNVKTNTSHKGQLTITLSEMASGINATALDRLYFDLSNQTAGVWQFNGSANDNRARYLAASSGTSASSGPAQYSTSAFFVDPAFITERGSVFKSMTTSQATVKVAKRIGEAKYYLHGANEPYDSQVVDLTMTDGEIIGFSWGHLKLKDVVCEAPQPKNVGMKYCEAVKGAYGVSYNTLLGNLEYSPALDFNGDGKINLSDFAAFGQHYGSAKAGNLNERVWCYNVIQSMANSE